MIQNYTFTCILALIIILIKKIFNLWPQNVLKSYKQQTDQSTNS